MNTPNYPLTLALTEAGWSNHETARLINERAQRDGHRGVAIDHTRVGRWIRRGEKPRPPVPELLASLLTQRLGRPCTPQQLQLAQVSGVLLFLEDIEHETLMARAAAANMTVRDYACLLLRSVLAQTF